MVTLEQVARSIVEQYWDRPASDGWLTPAVETLALVLLRDELLAAMAKHQWEQKVNAD